MVSKKKNSFSCEGGIEKSVPRDQIDPSLGITVCHQSASLVMSNGDPWDVFFYPTLALMMHFLIFQSIFDLAYENLVLLACAYKVFT